MTLSSMDDIVPNGSSKTESHSGLLKKQDTIPSGPFLWKLGH